MERNPSFRVVFYWMRRTVYVALVFSAVILALYFLDGPQIRLWSGMIANGYAALQEYALIWVWALATIGLIWQAIVWRTTAYSLTEKQFIFSKGVFNRKKNVVNYENIQNITVDRSFLEIVFMIATLRVETAGSKPGDAVISVEGVPSGEVEKLVREISSLSDSAKGKNRPEGLGGATKDGSLEELKEYQKQILAELREMKALLSHEKRRKD